MYLDKNYHLGFYITYQKAIQYVSLKILAIKLCEIILIRSHKQIFNMLQYTVKVWL